MKPDYCTWFPETWLGKDISDCCKIHDEHCSTNKFYRCLKTKIGYHAIYITIGGAIGCMVKYPLIMIKRIF